MEKPSQILNLEQNLEIELNFKTLDDLMNWESRNSYAVDENGNVIGLNLLNNKIEIEKLKDFTHLTSLDISNNRISNIENIKLLKNLSFLNLSYNPLIEIESLRSLKKLRYLAINHILAKKFDTLDNANLEILTIYSNNITNINFLAKLKKLKTLYIGENSIDDFAILSNLKELNYLDISSNPFNDLSFIKDLKKLQRLYCNKNENINTDSLQNLCSLTHLHLEGTNISDVSFLKKLTNLIELNLNKNSIVDLKPIKHLKSLIVLSLQRNKLTNLDFTEGLESLERLDLAENKIFDCSLLGNLRKLHSLNLRDNNVKDISFSKKLTNLIDLDINNNNVSSINSLKFNNTLQHLNLNNNNVANIKALKYLDNLQELHLFNNHIHDIDALKNLENLKIVDLENNAITDIFPLYSLIKKEIPVVLYNDEDENRIEINDNPINKPPLEFLDLGNETIIEYFDDSIKFGTQTINECKLIFIGDGGAGKTSLMKRLVLNEFNNSESTTHGINKIAWKELKNDNDQEITINLWDFGGQHLQHSLHQFFLSKRVIYVLVLNPRNDEKADYWLKQIENLGDESEVVIVYNWKEEKDKQASFLANYYELKKAYPHISEPYLLSCKTNEGIAELKEKIKKTILQQDNIKDQYPLNWFNIKSSLEELVTLEKNYISYENYAKICEDNNYYDDQKKKNLLIRLNNIGSIVFFEDPNLIQLQVLNPDWITTFAYSIITSEITNQKNGHLSTKDLKEIFKDEKEVFSNKISKVKYREDQFDFILKLMSKYDLCQINPFNHNEHLFPTSFKGSPECDYSNIKKTGKHYRFLFDTEFEMLIIYRFIARNLKKSTTKDFWQSGIYINDIDRKTFSLIETNRHTKIINCWITGDNIRGLWELIREDIKDICKIYDNLSFKEQILYEDGNKEIFLSYDEMLNSLRRGKKVIEWHPTYLIENIDVLNVLENFENTNDIMEDVQKYGNFINNGTIYNSQIGGVKNSQITYLNAYAENPTISKLKDILDDLQDAAKINFEWQENFTNALKAIYNLEEAKDSAEERIQVSKLNKFFDKAKKVKDWAAITLLPAEIATKGDKMIKMGGDLINYLSEFLNK